MCGTSSAHVVQSRVGLRGLEFCARSGCRSDRKPECMCRLCRRPRPCRWILRAGDARGVLHEFPKCNLRRSMAGCEGRISSCPCVREVTSGQTAHDAPTRSPCPTAAAATWQVGSEALVALKDVLATLKGAQEPETAPSVTGGGAGAWGCGGAGSGGGGGRGEGARGGVGGCGGCCGGAGGRHGARGGFGLGGPGGEGGGEGKFICHTIVPVHRVRQDTGVTRVKSLRDLRGRGFILCTSEAIAAGDGWVGKGARISVRPAPPHGASVWHPPRMRYHPVAPTAADATPHAPVPSPAASGDSACAGRGSAGRVWWKIPSRNKGWKPFCGFFRDLTVSARSSAPAGFRTG